MNDVAYTMILTSSENNVLALREELVTAAKRERTIHIVD